MYFFSTAEYFCLWHIHLDNSFLVYYLQISDAHFSLLMSKFLTLAPDLYLKNFNFGHNFILLTYFTWVFLVTKSVLWYLCLTHWSWPWSVKLCEKCCCFALMSYMYRTPVFERNISIWEKHRDFIHYVEIEAFLLAAKSVWPYSIESLFKSQTAASCVSQGRRIKCN